MARLYSKFAPRPPAATLENTFDAGFFYAKRFKKNDRFTSAKAPAA